MKVFNPVQFKMRSIFILREKYRSCFMTRMWSLYVVILTCFVGFGPSVRSFSIYGSLGATRPHGRKFSSQKHSTPYEFKLQGHNSEDVKINCQIARLNAVAAKLRAEAAELEAEQRKAMSDNLATTFREFNIYGSSTVAELKDSLADVLAKSTNEDQALKIVKAIETTDEKASLMSEYQQVEAFRNKFTRMVQDERDGAFMARREATTAKLAAEKAEAISELVNNRLPSVWDRLLGGLPYLWPLLDAFPYGQTLFLNFELAGNPFFDAFKQLHGFYKSIPLAGLITFLSLKVLTNNYSVNRLVRFNIQQSILLNMALILPGILQYILPSLAAATVGVEMYEEWSTVASSVLFVSLAGVFVYGVGCALFGVEADHLPVVSHYVKQRVPTSKEFLSMFDEDGNFKPPPAPALVHVGSNLTGKQKEKAGAATMSDKEKEVLILKKEKLIDDV